MFDIGFTQLLLIGVVALVVLGPERLPRVARTVGHLLGRAQRYVGDVKSDIQREMELDQIKDLKGQMEEAAKSVQSSVKDATDTLRDPLEQARKALQETTDSVESIVKSTQDDLDELSKSAQQELDELTRLTEDGLAEPEPSATPETTEPAVEADATPAIVQNTKPGPLSDADLADRRLAQAQASTANADTTTNNDQKPGTPL